MWYGYSVQCILNTEFIENEKTFLFCMNVHFIHLYTFVLLWDINGEKFIFRMRRIIADIAALKTEITYFDLVLLHIYHTRIPYYIWDFVCWKSIVIGTQKCQCNCFFFEDCKLIFDRAPLSSALSFSSLPLFDIPFFWWRAYEHGYLFRFSVFIVVVLIVYSLHTINMWTVEGSEANRATKTYCSYCVFVERKRSIRNMGGIHITYLDESPVFEKDDSFYHDIKTSNNLWHQSTWNCSLFNFSECFRMLLFTFITSSFWSYVASNHPKFFWLQDIFLCYSHMILICHVIDLL